jgi:putative oxygen-independent coproporphyrinogen III oxidase
VFGVYVHFPYCLSKCPYCDFASYVASRVPHEEYARAIQLELRLRAGEFVGLGTVRSVFFGGGTPSLWDVGCVDAVLRAIERTFPVAAEVEVSLEANPGAADAERFRALREAGVNRLSLGVQSFADRALHTLGRRHSGVEAEAAVERALRAGFSHVSLDLIHGAAGQTVDGARADARRGAATGVDHVSDYALTLEGLAVEVPMARAVRDGRLRVPDGDTQSDMGEAVRQELRGAGFTRYEISNFARNGARCAHNLGYWNGLPYLGVGVGAYGATPARRYGNGRDPTAYLAALADGHLPPGESETLTADLRFSERVFLSLRLTEGLDLRALATEFGDAPVSRLKDKALQLLAGGGREAANPYLALDQDRLALTDAGFDLHSEIAARLL